MRSGSCLCGAVAFEVNAELQDAITCHFEQCRKQSGHYFSAVAAPKAAVKITQGDALIWYRHTDIALRGFCSECGSSLFWRGDDSANIMVAMGALDAPTGLHVAGHYWVDFKGDYYTLDDDLPQHRGDSE